MTSVTIPSSPSRIVYPDSDGLPIAENTLQYQWMAIIKDGIDYLFESDPDVFVAGDLFWYPVEGHPEIRIAPDVMVVLGRPKGHRPSYLQWEEEGIAPQVVFEVISPSNFAREMVRKFDFYRRYGVEEYYLYDPDPLRLELSGYTRQGDDLVEIAAMNGHVSPRLKIRFEMSDSGLRIIRPDGQPFRTFIEVSKGEEQAKQRAELERHRADQALRDLEQLRQQLRSLGQNPTA